MLILKLGGSIITEKDLENPQINKDNLERIAYEIKESSVKELIIVHGAGSYGHPPAMKYKIGNPIKDDLEFKKIGFSITQNSVKKLNTYVCDSLIKQGVPCVSIQASSFIISKNKRITIADTNLIKRYVEEGFVPVIYGDVVLDLEETIKMSVLSGDQIINYLAKQLHAEKVILGTDVDGVYNKNPKTHSDAKLIKKVTSIEDIEKFESTTNIDVTGGMIGKIKELLELSEEGISSLIINANKKDIIKKALNNEDVEGTLVL